MVLSSEGVQQGDPLGPLLFCLSIHKMCVKLKSELAVFYLDDGTLGGNWKNVISDLNLIEEEVSELGLKLNRSMAELICSETPPEVQFYPPFPDFVWSILSMQSYWDHLWVMFLQ